MSAEVADVVLWIIIALIVEFIQQRRTIVDAATKAKSTAEKNDGTHHHRDSTKSIYRLAVFLLRVHAWNACNQSKRKCERVRASAAAFPTYIGTKFKGVSRNEEFGVGKEVKENKCRTGAADER